MKKFNTKVMVGLGSIIVGGAVLLKELVFPKDEAIADQVDYADVEYTEVDFVEVLIDEEA